MKKDNFSFPVFVLNDKEEIDVLSVELNLDKLKETRKNFYETQGFCAGTKQEKYFDEREIPLFEDGKANVVVQTLPRDEDECFFATLSDVLDFDIEQRKMIMQASDFVIKQYQPELLVENLFFPFDCRNADKHEMCKYLHEFCVGSVKNAPEFLSEILSLELGKVGVRTKTNYATRTLANTIWLGTVLQNFKNPEFENLKKEVLNCFEFTKKRSFSKEQIFQRIVKEQRCLMLTENAKKMECRASTTTGKILNHFAKFDENDSKNLEAKKVEELSELLSQNTVKKSTFDLVGAKIKLPPQNEPKFRPIC